MVSLRYLRKQEEAAARCARLEEARRIGSALGVQRARSYAMQKRLQAAKVRNDMQRQWACEVQQQAALIDRVMYDGQAKLGEGMRAAADVIMAHRQHAEEELNAWAAEHVLQRERHRVAQAAACVMQALQEEPRRSVVERKEAVRAAEDRRSRAVIKRPRPSKPNFAGHSSPLVGAMSFKNLEQSTPQPTTKAVTAAAVALKTDDCDGVASAARFCEERQQALAAAQQAVQRGQREAAERAAAYMSRRKEEERKASESAQRQAANLAAFEQRVSAALLNNNNNNDSAQCETGLLEVRRATMLRAKEEAEFEKVFFHGSLPLADDLSEATEEKNNIAGYGSDDDSCFFPLPSVFSLLPTDAEPAVKLLPRPFSVQPYNDVATADDAFANAASQTGDDGLGAVSVAQQPAPSIIPLTFAELPALPTLRASEEVQPVVMAATPASPGSPGSTSSALSPAGTPPKIGAVVRGGASASCESQALPLRHEHFLSNLKTLQEKLAKAALSVTCNESSDASLCHGTISISSMSSPPTPAQVLQEEAVDAEGYKDGDGGRSTLVMDTSGSSGSSFPSSMRSSSYPTMTADQLKAALLRLKSRMRAA